MNSKKIHINSEWQSFLKEELQSNSFKKILSQLEQERKYFNILPKNEEILNALNSTSINKLKVVILGQDPYPKKEQAHGLSFSVPKNVKRPASLRNIFKELKTDLNISCTSSGNLSNWANQGVLLLNSTLTVREKEPGSHQKIGWEQFTDKIIEKISTNKEKIIFLLWGSFAQKKSILIDKRKHFVLTTSHPSPLSSYRGFFGCKHFSKTNEILIKNRVQPIKWKID